MEMTGAIEIFTDLEYVKEALLEEGFQSPLFQYNKEGQVFSLIKPLNNLAEVHVRGYEDFTLDSEVELSREFFQHPFEIKPYYGYLIDILKSRGIPFKALRPIPRDPEFIKVPKKPTKWKSIVFSLVGGIGAIYGLKWLTRE